MDRRWRALGRLFAQKCPHCHETTWFGLHELPAGGLAGLFGGSTQHAVACESCRFAKELTDADAEIAVALRSRMRALERREATASELQAFLADHPMSVQRELADEGVSNACPNCSAENPGTFSLCWSCGATLVPIQELDSPTTPNQVGWHDEIFGANPLIVREDEKPPN